MPFHCVHGIIGKTLAGRWIRHETGKAYYHLPGSFEFYELYREFLPLFRAHREYFYDWCDIGSIYGAPADCVWGGGRAGFGEHDPKEVLALTREYGISARLTFSNSLLREEHLSDKKCNALCALFERENQVQSGVIVHSELLLDYLKTHYPQLYFVSSTTKVLTEFQQLRAETAREEFRYVVPDFRLNKAFGELDSLPQAQKDKVEFLCNECCWVGCRDRKRCYENVSRKISAKPAPNTSVPHRVRRKATASRRRWKSGVYRHQGHSGCLYADGIFQLQDRGPGTGQCAGTGISALLHDKTGIPAACPGSHLSGQYARPVLRNCIICHSDLSDGD